MSATIRRRIMPVSEREGLDSQIATAESDAKGESPEFSRDLKKRLVQQQQDPVAVRQLSYLKRVRAAGEPDTLSPRERARLEKREKELIPIVQKMMVPRTWVEEMPSNRKGSANPKFRKVVNEIARREMSKEYLGYAHELKNIRRQLRPEDRDAGNLEYIRPETESDAS